MNIQLRESPYSQDVIVDCTDCATNLGTIRRRSDQIAMIQEFDVLISQHLNRCRYPWNADNQAWYLRMRDEIMQRAYMFDYYSVPIPSQNIPEIAVKKGKALPHPELTPDVPLTDADGFRATHEAEIILRMNFPLMKHTIQGCHCNVCEERFLANYESFIESIEAGEKGAPENYNPETAEWAKKFGKKGR